MGSPPQMETMGAPQSSTAFKHCSTVSISLIVDLYSRMRPQPVQVRLQAWSGSSIMVNGNFWAPVMLLRARYPVMLAVRLKGTLIHYPRLQLDALFHRRESATRKICAGLYSYCRNGRAHRAETKFGRGDISSRRRRGNRCL